MRTIHLVANSAAIFLIGAAVSLLPTQRILGLNSREVNEIAKGSTILIEGQNPGSGVIIAKDANSYTVLTAKHVVDSEDSYQVVTPDDAHYTLDYETVEHVSELDLALVKFSSAQDYSPAEFGNSSQISEGDQVFIAGWPHEGEAIPHIYQLTTGEISGIAPHNLLAGGYRLIYTNVTRAGMSGGPVFSAEGKVIGIHGQAEGREVYLPGYEYDPMQERSGFSLGIPINAFLAANSSLSQLPTVTPETRPTTQFADALRVVEEGATPRDEGRRSRYYFTINLPTSAAAPLEQVTFEQILGVDYPRFVTREIVAFEGSRRNRAQELPLGMVVSDPDTRTVTVTFDPPVAPGRLVTIALRVSRNPREDAYQYRLTAYPSGSSSREQSLGVSRIDIYKPEPLR